MRAKRCARLSAAIALAVCLGGSPLSNAAETDGSKASAIPFKRPESTVEGGSWWRVVVGFGIVVALGGGAIYLLKRYVPASMGRLAGRGERIVVLEIRRLAPRLTLFLVEVDGEKVLLTQSGERVQQLQLGQSARASPAIDHETSV